MEHEKEIKKLQAHIKELYRRIDVLLSAQEEAAQLINRLATEISNIVSY